MKRILQTILLLTATISFLILYKTYLVNEKEISSENNQFMTNVVNEEANNLIENLKYEVQIEEDEYYLITSKFSEINYKNSFQLVNMKQVEANYVIKKNEKLTIRSRIAIYDNSNHNTNFRDKVVITYLDNIIISEKVDLDFANKILMISENIEYSNPKLKLKSDYIKLDLVTKKIDIYMNDNNSVKIETIK